MRHIPHRAAPRPAAAPVRRSTLPRPRPVRETVTRARSIILSLAAIGLLACPAGARTVAGVNIPESITVDGAKLVLNGAVLLEATVLAVDVYVAALYRPSKTRNGLQIMKCDVPTRLRLTFMRDISRSQLVETWRDEFRSRARKAKAEVRQAAMIDRMFGLYPKDGVEEDRTMIFDWKPGAGLTISYAGRRLGMVKADAEFCSIFLDGYVGPNSNYEDMRAGLLGRR